MFVSQEQLRSNPKLHFFTIREHLRVSYPEMDASPVLDCSCNPKGALAYKYFFDMQEENEFVTGTTCVQVTPAQQKLLELLTPSNAEDYLNSLTAIHELATYFVCDKDLVNLRASYQAQILINYLQELTKEQSLKTA